jgi:NAD(P)-dependent dehydrogenase (short-subunit alcohol dehydrogenase family)
MWDKVIALNLTAPAVVSGRAIKQWLKEGKQGSIVNIASIAGFRGFTCGTPAEMALTGNPYFGRPILIPHYRRCLHGKQARLDRPHEEHRRVLRLKGHSLQCRCCWRDGHGYRPDTRDGGR